MWLQSGHVHSAPEVEKKKTRRHSRAECQTQDMSIYAYYLRTGPLHQRSENKKERDNATR